MSHNLRTLGTFSQTYLAHILQARLEIQGIESFLSEETIFEQLDGVKIMVYEGKFDPAFEIYRQFELENDIL